MPDLLQIRTFVLTSQLGSLAAVARALKVSPAAISKQLTRLEQELGVQLLVRSTRRIELTEMGVRYCSQCDRILEEVEEANALISSGKCVPNGVLKVVSGRHFAHSYIIPHIKEFLTLYPEVELNLELAERIPDLNHEAIDILIGMSISATGNVIQKRIETTSYVLCASSDYLKRYGTPKKPSDLKKHRYLGHSMRVPDNELSFRGQESVIITPYIKVNDAEVLLKLALDGLGIIKLHHYVVKDYLDKGVLKELLANYRDPPIPVYVAYPQRKHVSSKVRCFIDFIVDKIKHPF